MATPISPDWEHYGFLDPNATDSPVTRELLAFYDSQGLKAADFAGLTPEELVLTANRRSIRTAPRFDADAVRQAAQMDADLFEELVRITGYPETDDAFTSVDVHTFQLFNMAAEFFSEEEMIHFTAVMTASLSRIADAAATLFRVDVTPEVEAAGGSHLDYAKVNFEVAEIVKSMAEPMWAIFALQLELAGARSDEARSGIDPSVDANIVRMGVGFVDLVGFTPLTVELPDSELAVFIRGFEQEATAIISSHGGRLVKLIGDEVMFVAVDANDVVRIAVALMAAFRERGIQPHGGVAYGNLVARGGDYYGRVVNMASRMANLAVPGELLVESELAHVATDHTFEPAGRRQLKGFPEPIRLSSLVI